MEYVEKVPLSYFADEVVVATEGIEIDMAESYIRNAIIDFCTRTQVLRRTFEITLECGADEYLIDLNEDERLVSLKGSCSGYELLRSAPCGTNCYGRSMWFVPPQYLMISPKPTGSGGKLTITTSVAPNQDCCEVDRLLYDKYREVIINGALARLHLVKSAKWYDPNLAVVFSREYQRGIAQANSERLMGVARNKIKMTGGKLYV